MTVKAPIVSQLATRADAPHTASTFIKLVRDPQRRRTLDGLEGFIYVITEEGHWDMRVGTYRVSGSDITLTNRTVSVRLATVAGDPETSSDVEYAVESRAAEIHIF